MNRRDFIKTLAGLMALPLMKPEVLKPDYSPSLEAIKALSKTPSSIEEGLAVWNGETWARLDKSIEFGAEGELYIKGDFLLESPEEIRRRHLEYYKSHDPNS